MENTTVTRDSIYWFPDGNIVLLTHDCVAFRVHQSVLSLHSEFFAGMFEDPLPIPEDAVDKDEILDGCRIVPLGDTAYDIRHLVTIMYGKGRVHTSVGALFSVFAALVRVGHKYGVHDIVDECIPRLRQMVPTTLEDYEQARDYRSAIKFASHHALEALHVFRLVDIGADDPRILPFMLFLCAQLDEHDLRNGTARVDGTPETLSTADIERILVLKGELQGRGDEALRDVYTFSGPLRSCKRYEDISLMIGCPFIECNEGYDNFVTRIPMHVQDAYRNGGPLDPWLVNAMRDIERKDWVCATCIGPKRKKQVQLREESWHALPVLAGMSGGGQCN